MSQLAGKTILVTRPKEQAVEFVALLQAAGATVVEFPAIRITDPPSWAAYDSVVQKIEDFEVIAFTSSNAVRYFMKRMPEEKNKNLRSKKIFAVGTKTKKVSNQFNLNAEVITSVFRGKELGREIMKQIGKGEKILFPHGNKGRFELTKVLRDSGYDVTDLIVYQNSSPDKNDIDKFRTELSGKFIDVYTFFSPSSIKNFLDVFPEEIPGKAVVAVIGPTTAAAAMKLGLTVHIEAPKSTSEDLAYAIGGYFSGHGNK